MRLQHNIALVAIGSTLLFACSQPCPPAPEHFTHSLLSIPPEADANIAVVEGFLNACVKADTVAMRAAMDPGYYGILETTPIDSSSVEQVISDWRRIDSTRTDQKLTTNAAEGNRYASGKWQGDWVNYWGEYKATDKATGKSFVVPFFFDAQVKGGKLMKSYIYYDVLSVYNQLGIAPPAAPATK